MKFKDKKEAIITPNYEREENYKLEGSLDLRKLLKDIEKLGLPTIHNYNFGFYFIVKIEDLKISNNVVDLLVKDKSSFFINFNEAYLEKIKRPDNLLIECDKCYRIIQKETDRSLGFIYWEKSNL